jgi:hypothetical protein
VWGIACRLIGKCKFKHKEHDNPCPNQGGIEDQERAFLLPDDADQPAHQGGDAGAEAQQHLKRQGRPFGDIFEDRAASLDGVVKGVSERVTKEEKHNHDGNEPDGPFA